MAIDLDVVTRLNKAAAREAAREAQNYFQGKGRDVGEDFGDDFSKGLNSKIPEVQKAFDKVTAASGKLITEQEKLNTLMEKGSATKAQLVTQSERVARAYREEESAIRSANSILNDHTSATKEVEIAGRGAAASLADMGIQLGGLTKLATPAVMAAAGAAIADVAAAAASASQAIIVLPAALGAAGAAFGTLKLATLGFSDALDSIRDPEKFAEALKALSPNAQQAALSIQNLLPAFDQLRTVTQDALFAGIGEQINTLTNQYLPLLRDTTTGIAGAFNSMFDGVSDQLMTPETQQSIQVFADNVAASFQALAPATGPLTKALGDLMAVGSTALPTLADAAANAATAFSNFITEASQSGNLQRWLDDGLTTLQQLGSVAWDFGQAFMALAPIGQEVMPDIVTALSGIAQAIPGIVEGAAQMSDEFAAVGNIIGALGPAIGLVASAMDLVPDKLQAIMQPLTAISEVIDAVKFLFGDDKSGPFQTAQSKLDEEVKRRQQLTASGRPQPGMSGGGGSWSPTAGLPGVPSGGFSVPTGVNPGWTGERVPAGTVFGGAQSVGGGGGRSGGGGGRAAERAPSFDPSQWSVDSIPVASAPTAGTGFPTSAPTPGSSLIVDQGKVFDADTRVISAKNSVEEARRRVLELEAKGNASQDDLITAKNNVVERERAYTTALRELTEAQQGTWEKANDTISGAMSDLESIFAPMDSDFGISGGLPGVAKWLTTFLGNFALAGAIKSSPELQAGAIALQQNGGVAPGLFNRGLFTQDATTAQTAGYPAASTAGYSSAATGGYAGDAALLSNVPSGRYSQTQAADLTKGIADCSSAVEDLVNIMDGRPTSGRSMATGNADQWLPAHGFLPGSMPGAFNVGFNDHHMQATLPGGTPFNWGSDSSAARGGVGGSGAFDPAFTDHYYRPVAPAPSAMGPAPLGGGVGSPGWGTASGPLPTSGGGGQSFGMGLPGPAGGGVTAGAQAVPAGFPTGVQPSANSGGGGGGIGLSGEAMGLAGGAMDMMAPGSSIGLKLANRAVQFGGQAAAIGVQGAMETFLPHGSEAAGNSWFAKIAGGIAGARPATPNQAGKSAPPQPQQNGQQEAGNTHNGPMVNIEKMETGGADGQGVANDLARMQYQAGGPR